MGNENPSLPKWASRFLKLICPDKLYEEIEGDLIQQHLRYARKHSQRYAKWKLFVNVIRYFRPGIVFRNRLTMTVLNFLVIRNYITTSYRHVLRSKLNAFFKLSGLTLAFFSLLVVSLYVSYQLSFDTYHEGNERIYRVNTERMENGLTERYGIAPVAFGQILSEGFPEVESYTRIDIRNGSHIRFRDKVVWGGVFPADSSLFDVLTFRFVKGNRKALAKPNSIVLTRSFAENIFGEEEPLHKILTVDGDGFLYEVTAVVEDMPYNSHFRVEAFVQMKRDVPFNLQSIVSPPEFVDNSSILYVKLRSPASEESFISGIERALDKFIPRKDREKAGFRVFLQPLGDLYFDAPLKYEFTRKGSTVYLYTFLILGVFLLCIACINYTNLSLANFVNRAREIGVRKVMGGGKAQIALQVAIETFSYCLIALFIGLGLLYLLFPKVVHFIEPRLEFSMLANADVLISVSILFLFLVLASAALPAIWFSGSKPANDLKGVFIQSGKLGLNRSLLFVQFMISVICISATLVVGKQIDFIHNKDLGLDRTNLLVLTMPEDFTTGKMISFKSALRSVPGVRHVSNSSFRIGGGYWKDWYTVEVNGEMKSFELYEVFSDDELFTTLGMKVISGRVFDAEHRADSGAAFVINETAAHYLGLNDPVGTRIFTHPEEPGEWDGTIVGVVNDINISTLHQKVQPLVMRLPWQNRYPEYFVYVRLQDSARTTINDIKKRYSEINPGYPLEMHYVDDFYNERYEKERKAYASLQFGTVIILLISSLGIFSLSAYLSIRRMKEFGIRKVLGATTRQIAQLHVLHFMKVAIIASAVALPLSWYIMSKWLQEFAYRTDLSVSLFVVVLLLMLVLIVMSAGYSAYKAGIRNPAEIISKS